MWVTQIPARSLTWNIPTKNKRGFVRCIAGVDKRADQDRDTELWEPRMKTRGPIPT